VQLRLPSVYWSFISLDGSPVVGFFYSPAVAYRIIGRSYGKRIKDAAMKGIGVLLVVLGAACFLLPIFHVEIPWLIQLGEGRTLLSLVLILVGAGIFFFSGD
jgi:hypothetical protein